MRPEPNLIVSSLRKETPPSDLNLLKQIQLLDWNNITEADFDICSEIILRITADVMMCADIKDPGRRQEYRRVFLAIQEGVENSTLPAKFGDFRQYFSKYVKRLEQL